MGRTNSKIFFSPQPKSVAVLLFPRSRFGSWWGQGRAIALQEKECHPRKTAPSNKKSDRPILLLLTKTESHTYTVRRSQKHDRP
ncbi:hypothetical protein QUA41_09070 [Microcoleus sp. Pol11C1]|uniref:hypothetical protein n=1 Tax=unclassified Microcoleus TaxID=2642155 RepID=UPI002FD54E5A